MGSGLLANLADTADGAETILCRGRVWEKIGKPRLLNVPFSAATWGKFGSPVLWKSPQTGSLPAKPPLTSMPRCSIGPSLPVPSVLVPDEGGNKGQETSAPAEAIEPWGVVGNTLAPPENVGTEAALVPPPPSLSSFPLPMWPGQNLLNPGAQTEGRVFCSSKVEQLFSPQQSSKPLTMFQLPLSPHWVLGWGSFQDSVSLLSYQIFRGKKVNWTLFR